MIEDNEDDVLEMKKRKNVSGRMPIYPLKERRGEEPICVIQQIKVSIKLLEETYGKIFERVKIKEDSPFSGIELADALEEAGITIPIEWGTKHIQPRHIYFIHNNDMVDVRGVPLHDKED